ncbi:olfactory receptor 5V1-like [Ambystoma mexicanum]|uniref:olfactory receptor 5V1-like n=1 Tax=Ambystoma mexicanum TaxID=8296 RepID=UPI0037E8318D
MDRENQTSTNKFIIVGFSDFPQLKVPLFVAFLLIYLLTLVGNVFIMAIVYSNSKLHTPMYFFLTNLSCLDITYATIIFPKMLANFFMEVLQISLSECQVQIYFFIVVVGTEFLLLAVMAYDRYVAICNPLRYMVIINKSLCIQMAVGTWAVSLIVPIPHIIALSWLTFCDSRTMNHFFCDLTALMKLSCTSTQTVETLSYSMGVLVGLMPFGLTITSYIKIISAILKMKSTEGRRKAFSTCGSHLTVVILFYGTILSTYMRPTSTYSIQTNKLLSLSYIVVTPLCNPIIYSLKNTELKNTLRKKKNTV